MSSSVTRADVSSWQLQEVTTNPISSSPRCRSTTEKRPDREGGCGTRAVGHGVRGKQRERERGEGEGDKGPSLVVGATFCVSGATSCQIGLKWASPSGAPWLARLPGAQLIVSPSSETLSDFDGAYLGGQ